jgi:acetyl esterase/lipase
MLCRPLVPCILIFLSCGVARSQQHTLPLWPNGNPEPSHVVGPEFDPTQEKDRMLAGKPTTRLTNVSHPNMAVYLVEQGKNTGAGALVLPGGGYDHLAYTHEGIEVCNWLNSIGVNCILVKYRVPEKGRFPENVEDLEDVQQAMRITREHAIEWHIDPDRLGVVGFSAGAHLAVVLSTHPDFQGSTAPPSKTSAKPDFQMVIYPGSLRDADGRLSPVLTPTSTVPPTFLLQAEDDNAAHVETSLVYYQALKDAKIPAELHVYAQGGHGFGLRPTELPVSHWPELGDRWLHTVHILGTPVTSTGH